LTTSCNRCGSWPCNCGAITVTPSAPIVIQVSTPTQYTQSQTTLQVLPGQGGARGIQGTQGLQGSYGVQGATGTSLHNISYTYTQATPSATWTINHNLGYNPNLTVQDSAGTIVEGEISYTNSNSLTVTFSAAFSGYAYLS